MSERVERIAGFAFCDRILSAVVIEQTDQGRSMVPGSAAQWRTPVDRAGWAGMDTAKLIREWLDRYQGREQIAVLNLDDRLPGDREHDDYEGEEADIFKRLRRMARVRAHLVSMRDLQWTRTPQDPSGLLARHDRHAMAAQAAAWVMDEQAREHARTERLKIMRERQDAGLDPQ